jgi:hypothetical protein
VGCHQCSLKIYNDDPKTLDEAIRRAKCLYYQHRGIPNFHKDWEDKKRGNMEQRNKGNKPLFFKNNSQGKPDHNESRILETLGKIPRKQPMKCWGCEGDHMYRYFPHRGEKVRIVHNVQNIETVDEMGKSMPRIYETLDNKQVEFKSHMIEVQGKIKNQPIDILIDSGDNHSCIGPKMVEKFHLTRSGHGKLWFIQLAKRRINEIVKDCPMEMNGLRTKDDLNIIPLGSYDCLIGMY